MLPSETLKSGTSLMVPGAAAPGTATPGTTTKGTTTAGGAVTETSKPAATPVVTHTVQRGETLFSISNRYGLTLEELRSMNGISGNAIQVGQKLRVKGQPAPPPAQKTQYHTVKRGETLFSISNRYGVSVDDLKQWNNIRNNNLMAGKKIIVKK